jgi:hypothetical protein
MMLSWLMPYFAFARRPAQGQTVMRHVVRNDMDAASMSLGAILESS